MTPAPVCASGRVRVLSSYPLAHVHTVCTFKSSHPKGGASKTASGNGRLVVVRLTPRYSLAQRCDGDTGGPLG
ncbi:hypothetical protein BDR03DRAFT_974200 [Suillus americanus]|nr:hypothetical protein BDR03DRAFT_974200 [Suillus americanus]